MERTLSYSWILPGRLAVGERPPALSRLIRLGFQAVLNLQEEEEPNPEPDAPGAIRFQRVAIRDGIMGGVPTVEAIARSVEVLRGFQDAGLATYVHCYAGVGRSPTICMAYLAVTEGLSLAAAYERVSSAHDRTGPTAGQLDALASYLQRLRRPQEP